MKKTLALAVLAACAIAFTGTAVAAPFASKIAVADKSVAPGATINVTYFLNEAADTVVVDLLNAGGTVVATSANGTKVAGNNTASIVAPAAAGADYRVRVTATGNNTSGAPKVLVGKQSGATARGPEYTPSSVFLRFSPRKPIPVTDQNLDDFGKILAVSNYASTTSYNGFTTHSATINFDSALNFWYAGDTQLGFETRNNKFYENDNTAPTTSYTMDADFLDKNNQAAGIGIFNNVYRPHRHAVSSTLNDANMVAITYSGTQTPRGGVIFSYGGKTYSAHTQGTVLVRAEMNATVSPMTGGADVTVATGAGYSKTVFDYNGNLYFVDRNGKKIYRYTYQKFAEMVSAVLPNGADCVYDFATPLAGFVAAEGPISMAVSPDGILYAFCATATAAQGSRVVKVGTGTETGDVALDSASVVYTYPFAVNAIYGSIGIDAGGNFILADNTAEVICVVAPAGASSVPVKAPLSQNISVVPPAAVNDWSQF